MPEYAKGVTYRDVLDQLAGWAESDANRWAEQALAELVNRFGQAEDPWPTGRFSLVWRDPGTGERTIVASGKTRKQADASAESEPGLEIVQEYV